MRVRGIVKIVLTLVISFALMSWSVGVEVATVAISLISLYAWLGEYIAILKAGVISEKELDIYEKNLEKTFTKNLIERSSKFQTELLNKAIKLLKNNHEMIYSTCTILYEENEKIIKRFLDSKLVEIVPIEKDLFKNAIFLPSSVDGTLCIAPTDLYEGFFVAKLKKL